MRRALQTYLFIALAIGGVFAVTFITQFSRTPPKKTDAEPGSGPAVLGPPLTIIDAEMHYDPKAELVAHRAFAGFLEIGKPELFVGFWFQNRNPRAVAVSARERTCVSCTSAKAAVVPAEALAEYAAHVALTGLPATLAPLPDIMSPLALAVLNSQLKWHAFDFDPKGKPFVIPAAADPNRPTVGLIALGFTAKAPGPPKAVSATFDAVTENGPSQAYPFAVTFAPVHPFFAVPGALEVGEMPEGAASKTLDIFVYSPTRPPADLPVPAAIVNDAEGFVAFGTPQTLNETEIHELTKTGSEALKYPLRIRSAYRLPVTVHRELPGKQPDVGAYDRDVTIAVPGTTHTVTVHIKGRMTGLVRIEGAEKVAMGSYNSDLVATKKFTIYSDKPGLDLELDAARCVPPFCQYTIDPPKMEGTRKYWKVLLTIPAKEGRKAGWEGFMFLRTKGAAAVNVRLPVSGNGVGR